MMQEPELSFCSLKCVIINLVPFLPRAQDIDQPAMRPVPDHPPGPATGAERNAAVFHYISNIAAHFFWFFSLGHQISHIQSRSP